MPLSTMKLLFHVRSYMFWEIKQNLTCFYSGSLNLPSCLLRPHFLSSHVTIPSAGQYSTCPSCPDHFLSLFYGSYIVITVHMRVILSLADGIHLTTKNREDYYNLIAALSPQGLFPFAFFQVAGCFKHWYNASRFFTSL